MRTLGYIIATVVSAVIVANGSFMLISPKAWFRLRWVGLHGTLTKEEYSSGWRSLTIRLRGVAMLAFLGWVLYNSLVGPATGQMIGSFSSASGTQESIHRWACLVTCIGILVCGLTMLFLPEWWIKRYWRAVRLEEAALVRIVRISSLLVIVAAALFLMQCFTIR